LKWSALIGLKAFSSPKEEIYATSLAETLSFRCQEISVPYQ
jgi:hypothetical protein